MTSWSGSTAGPTITVASGSPTPHAYYHGTGDTAAPPGATCAIFPALTQRNKLPLVTARLNADPQWRFVATINSFDVWLRNV